MEEEYPAAVPPPPPARRGCRPRWWGGLLCRRGRPRLGRPFGRAILVAQSGAPVARRGCGRTAFAFPLLAVYSCHIEAAGQ